MAASSAGLGGGPRGFEIDRPSASGRDEAPRAADGSPEEVAVCGLCGLVTGRPFPAVCPACGGGYG